MDRQPRSNTVRLIDDPAASGPWNMAADASLLVSAAESQRATLRFYRWDQPTLSLGYFQHQAARQTHPASLGCPLVRRPSGGGAIVHDEELTYSLSWPVTRRADDMAAQLVTTLHQALVEALACWGCHAQLHAGRPAKPTANEPFLCFGRRALGDVCVGQHKVLGSAQRRRRGAILQHGSLLWARSTAAPELPGIADLAREVGLTAAEGRDQLVKEWQHRIFAALSVRPAKDHLSDDEVARAHQLVAHKFASDGWNLRR